MAKCIKMNHIGCDRDMPTIIERVKESTDKPEGFLSRHALKISAFAIAVSATSTISSYITKHEDGQRVCDPVDEAAVQEYNRQIEIMYDKTSYTLSERDQLVSDLMDSTGANDLRVAMPDSLQGDGTAIDITKRLSAHIPTQYIEASGIEEVVLADLNVGLNADVNGYYLRSGLYSIKRPNTILIDEKYVLTKPKSDIIMTMTHEMAHSAVAKLCNVYYPPKQYTDTNPRDFKYGDLGNAGKVEVSKYAETEAPEAIAEMIATLMDTHKTDAKDALVNRLASDDPIAERKVAVAATMLDKLSPGLGKTAMLYLHF